ncbi:MAG: hypothetical protein ABIK66_05915 [candidate division WOR-3 bacterium]
MPFWGLLKRELFGKEPIERLNESQIEFLTGLTQDVLSIIREEIKQVDFWESYPKQKRLKVLSNISLYRENKFLFGTWQFRKFSF